MYVWRDEDGKIVGVFSAPLEGLAEEWLEPDDPELVQFWIDHPLPRIAQD